MQEEAFDIADKVVVFNRGRVEQYGEPQELARSPASPFVMQFVSDVNTLPSTSLARPGLSWVLLAQTSVQALLEPGNLSVISPAPPECLCGKACERTLARTATLSISGCLLLLCG